VLNGGADRVGVLSNGGGFIMRLWIMPALAFSIVAAGSSASAQALRIINDPTSLDWEYYGSGYKLKPIRDPSFPGGEAAVQFDVEKGNDPFTAGTNIHLNQPIVTGRNYVVRFWARTISAKSSDGKGRIVVRFARNSDPYPGFGDTTVAVGPDWRSYEVTGRATLDASTSEAVVGMQLASLRQVLQIGQAVVAEGATTLAGQQLRIAAPDPLPPQLAGKGDLLNDPTDRNWVVYGKLLTTSPTTTDVYTRKAVLLSVSGVGENSWDAGVNVPIHGVIATGDNLVVAVLARSRSADGQGWIRLRLQSNQPPYDGFGAEDLRLTPNWRLYSWRVQSQMDLPAHIGEVAIHAGMAKQEAEIGPVYVLRLPSTP
jgi:hypothetical protein